MISPKAAVGCLLGGAPKAAAGTNHLNQLQSAPQKALTSRAVGQSLGFGL